jgi:hypothetical protein
VTAGSAFSIIGQTSQALLQIRTTSALHSADK